MTLNDPNVMIREVKPQVEDSTFIRPTGHRGQAVRLDARFGLNPNGFEIVVPVGPGLTNSHVYFPAYRKKGYVCSKIGFRLIVWVKADYSGRKITIRCTGHRVVKLYLPNDQEFTQLVDRIQQEESFVKVSDVNFEQFMTKIKFDTIMEAFHLMNRRSPWYFICKDHMEGATFGNVNVDFIFGDKIIQEIAANLAKDYKEILRIMSGHLVKLNIAHDRDTEESIVLNFRLSIRVQEFKVEPDGALHRNLIFSNVSVPRRGGFFATLARDLFPCFSKPLTLEDFDERIEPVKELKISGPFFPRKLD